MGRRRVVLWADQRARNLLEPPPRGPRHRTHPAVGPDMEGEPARRKQILWQIEHKLAEDDARPIIFYADGGTCMRPWVKGQIVMVNSIFNGARREDVWLDK